MIHVTRDIRNTCEEHVHLTVFLQCFWVTCGRTKTEKKIINGNRDIPSEIE